MTYECIETNECVGTNECIETYEWFKTFKCFKAYQCFELTNVFKTYKFSMHAALSPSGLSTLPIFLAPSGQGRPPLVYTTPHPFMWSAY